MYNDSGIRNPIELTIYSAHRSARAAKVSIPAAHWEQAFRSGTRQKELPYGFQRMLGMARVSEISEPKAIHNRIARHHCLLRIEL